MKGDFTRNTFNPRKHYRGVLMQQGRVQLDADWNENLDILLNRIETETIDVIGYCGVPIHDAGFGILETMSPALTSGDFGLSKGRAYVDGILLENDVDVAFSQQPHILPKPGPKITTSGVYLLFLDVWQRHIIALDDKEIREVALGGPDTATRVQTIWQAKVHRLGNVGQNFNCSDAAKPWPAASTGKLAARTHPESVPIDPCEVGTGGGYKRLENQLYRVEVHKGSGMTGGPTFKWSRDNGSVVVAISEFNVDSDPEKIKVTSLGRDSVLGLHELDWVEVVDDAKELAGEPGTIAQIEKIDPEQLVITLSTSATGFDVNGHPKLRRWDTRPEQTSAEFSITVPSGNDGFIPLEGGVEVKFQIGTFRTGDYWLIPARTIPGKFGDIEWPLEGGSPAFRLTFGNIHHYCKLALLNATGTTSISVSLLEDCRKKFPPLTELPTGGKCCCTVSVGPEGDYPTLQEAVDARPAEYDGVWHVCMMPGEHRMDGTVEVSGTKGLVISGCEWQSQIVGADDEPILIVKGSNMVRVEGLYVRARSRKGAFLFDDVSDLKVTRNVVINSGEKMNEDEIAKLEKAAKAGFAGQSSRLGPVLLLHDCNEVDVLDNMFRGQPAIKARGDSLRILRNTLSGTVQIFPGSDDVVIEDNRILKSYGAGIQLGGVSKTDAKDLYSEDRKVIFEKRYAKYKAASGDLQEKEAVEATKKVDATGESASFGSPVMKANSVNSRYTVGTDRDLFFTTRFVRIGNNLIGGCLGSGIITTNNVDDLQDFGNLEDVTISGNRIIHCAQKPDLKVGQVVTGGGIILTGVFDLSIESNLIVENGKSLPACGIFILDGGDISITDNVVAENGLLFPDELAKEMGVDDVQFFQAGIAALGVVGNNLNLLDFATSKKNTLEGSPALRVVGNEVTSPEGHALMVLSLGTTSVHGNLFTTRESRKQPAVLGADIANYLNLGACVAILDYGISSIIMDYLNLVNTKTNFEMNMVAAENPLAFLPDGRVLFNDNQVYFNTERDLDEKSAAAVTNKISAAIGPFSVLILSFDDISMSGNQLQASTPPYLLSKAYLKFINAMAMGVTIRATGNFFNEGWFSALLSYFSYGLLNVTVGNEAVHYLYPLPVGPKTKTESNVTWI
jgi:hypothetical protein